MAFKLLKSSFFRFIPPRTYSSVEPCAIQGTNDYEVKSTSTRKGIVVASGENQAAISRISIGYRAGTRNENRSTAGTVQVLKNCGGNSTKNATRFCIASHLQQSGGCITIQADREALIYTLTGTRKSIEKTLPFLTEVATQPAFRPWEVSEAIDLARQEAASCPASVRVLDLVHKAAYRGTGLGNPTCPDPYQFGKLNAETLRRYVANHCNANRMAVVGLGVDQNELVSYAEKLNVDEGDGSSGSESKYRGGEVRQDGPGDVAHVAIAVEGASLSNPTEVFAFRVLQKAFGSGPAVKRGPRDNGVINRAIGDDDGGGYSLRCFNFNYSDSGLFGVLISAPGKSIGKIAQVAYETLKEGRIEDEDVVRGLNGIKVAMMMECEDTSSAFDNLVWSSLLLGEAQSPGDCSAAVEKVTEDAVAGALAKIAASNMSVAALGNVGGVPYGDEFTTTTC